MNLSSLVVSQYCDECYNMLWKATINSLSPNSDQHQISPCNIDAYSNLEVMRIKDTISQGKFSWYFNNFYSVLL